MLAQGLFASGRVMDLYVPAYAEEVGVSPEDAPTLLTISAAVTIGVRFFVGFFVDLKLVQPSTVTISSCVIMGLALAFTPLYTDLNLLVAFSVVSGLFKAQFANLAALVYLEVVPLKKLAKVLAMSQASQSLMSSLTNVLHGTLIAATGTFASSFQLMAGCYLLGALLQAVRRIMVGRRGDGGDDGDGVKDDGDVDEYVNKESATTKL